MRDLEPYALGAAFLSAGMALAGSEQGTTLPLLLLLWVLLFIDRPIPLTFARLRGRARRHAGRRSRSRPGIGLRTRWVVAVATALLGLLATSRLLALHATPGLSALVLVLLAGLVPYAVLPGPEDPGLRGRGMGSTDNPAVSP